MKILKANLTRLEDNFTDHDPAGSEVKLDFHETTETSVQIDGNISCILQHCIRHVCVEQWPSIVVLSAHAEEYLCFSKHLLTQNEIKIQLDATVCSLIYFTAKSLYVFRV